MKSLFYTTLTIINVFVKAMIIITCICAMGTLYTPEWIIWIFTILGLVWVFSEIISQIRLYLLEKGKLK